MKPKIYLAAPLFNPMERDFNADIADCLSADASVFLPQRDGDLLTRLLAEGCSLEVARRRIYDADVSAVAECDILVAVLDGRTIDEGVAFELGFARGLGKTCVAFKSDDRSLLLTGDNPMITGACDVWCSTKDALVAAVRSFERREFEPKVTRRRVSREETPTNVRSAG